MTKAVKQSKELTIRICESNPTVFFSQLQDAIQAGYEIQLEGACGPSIMNNVCDVVLTLKA